MRKDELRNFMLTGKIERRRFAVYGFFPNGLLVKVKGGFRRHRDAWNHMLDRKDELKSRFGMELFVKGEQ